MSENYQEFMNKKKILHSYKNLTNSNQNKINIYGIFNNTNLSYLSCYYLYKV